MLPVQPQLRWIAAAGLVNTIGTGLFVSISVLWFTQIVGFGIGQVAAVMTGAGLIGLLAAIPLGHLADRYGPARMQVTLLLAMGGLALGNLFVGALWHYAVIATLLAMCDRGVSAVGGAVVAAVATGPERVRARAFLNVVLNLGLVVGSALAFVVLAVGSPGAYRVAIVVDALSFAVSGLAYLKVSAQKTISGPPPWAVFRDRRFVRVVGLFSILEMHRAMLTVALPIWIVQHVKAPQTLVSVVLLINVTGVVLFQIPFSRRAESVASAVRATRAGGGLLLLACLFFALAPGLGPVMLLFGVIAQTVADLAVSAGRFCITFELADDRAQGQYQGFVSVGRGVTFAIAPLVMAGLPLRLGATGWLLLGALFLAAGLLFGVALGPRSPSDQAA